MRIAVKREDLITRIYLVEKYLSFCLRDYGIVPLPLRHPRVADFSRLLSVNSLVLSTPESITPLERLAPYLLLISFSFIQFTQKL